MDYQNAEFYKLNKNNPDLVYNFADELITYRKETDENGKRSTVEVDIADEDIKLTNMVLCSDALNAVCAYFALNSISASHKYNPHVQDIF